MQVVSMAVEYAMIAMVYLALRHSPSAKKKKRVITVDEISKETGISISFLSKIMLLLYRAGLVRSSRGRNGGYLLAKPPERISCHDVLKAVEGPVRMNVCQIEPEKCPATFSCPFYSMWCELQSNVENILSSYSLHSIAVNIKGLSEESEYFNSLKKRF